MHPPVPPPEQRAPASSEEGARSGVARTVTLAVGTGARTASDANRHPEDTSSSSSSVPTCTSLAVAATQPREEPHEGEAHDRTIAEEVGEDDHEASLEVPIGSERIDDTTNGDLRRRNKQKDNDTTTANAITTRQPPPTADAFVRWYLERDDDIGEESVEEDSAMGAPSPAPYGPVSNDKGDAGSAQDPARAAPRADDAESQQHVRSRTSRAAEDEWAVRNFMGPRSNSLKREIQRLRRRQRHHTSILTSNAALLHAQLVPGRLAAGRQHPTSGGERSMPDENRRHGEGSIDEDDEIDDSHHYKSVSFRLVDTPVWHNFALSLQDAPQRSSSSPSMITCVRRGLTGETARTVLRRRIARRNRLRLGGRAGRRHDDTVNNHDHADDHDPVRTYIRDARFLLRFMIAMIGFLASVVGFVVSTSSNLLLDVKNEWVVSVFDRSGAATGYAVFLLVNLALGIVSHLPVAYRPVSAGSGIAEAKAVLNGIILPSCTEIKSAACKAVSVVFSGAASLPVGLEGPLIFSGLSIGTNIHRLLFVPGSSRRGKSSSPAATYPTLQTQRAQRDLAACGTAAGVTSAFFSPLGGVMFAMEEGCSFWSVGLAWQTFASSCTAVIFSYLWVLGFVQHKLGEPFQLLTLGKFTGLPGDDNSVERTPAPLRFWFYVLFAGMGVAAGILGSIWCEASRRLSIWRAQREMGRRLKLLEVLVLVALSSTLTWWLPQAYRECTPLNTTVAADSYFRTFGCPEGQYNQLATLLLNPPGEVSLNLLFWEGPDSFSVASCLLAAAIYLIVLLILFGSAMSMGIFIPLLFAGACLGRALGVALEAGAGTTTFAIVGSVAMVAGVTRILISITVIMMTATNAPYLVSCFMVTSLFARVTGKWMFGRDGIYDIILELKRIPFLESTLPTNVMLRGLRAGDLVKSQPFVTLHPEQAVGSLLEALELNPHLPDFVVVDSAEGALLGVISREDVRVLLDHAELFYTRRENRRVPVALTHEYLMQSRRRNKPEDESTHLHAIRDKLTEDELGRYLDLTPYISMAHYQFDIHGSCERAYELFRTLGLRTLVITSPNGVPRGVLSRYDLKLLDEVNVDDRHKHLRETDRNLIFSFKSITSS